MRATHLLRFSGSVSASVGSPAINDLTKEGRKRILSILQAPALTPVVISLKAAGAPGGQALPGVPRRLGAGLSRPPESSLVLESSLQAFFNVFDYIGDVLTQF